MEVIGDKIFVNGYHVGDIRNDVPTTIRQRFIALLEKRHYNTQSSEVR